jgi:tRNA1Val (adenine37-N6)-methyltransferase
MNQFIPDTFFNGQIFVKQDKYGYRFSIDAILLADFIKVKPLNSVVDLGTGCGILPIILAFRNPNTNYWGVEIQNTLADIAKKNVIENSLDKRIQILCEDMKSIACNMVSGPVDIVVSNPPYRKMDSGRINPNSQRAVARHEIKIKLEEMLTVAGRILRTAGKFFTIYPADRTIDLLSGMRKTGIEPKRIRTIHSNQGAEAKLVLVEGAKGGGSGIKILDPLIIYKDQDNYTNEIEKMFLP